jgi:uncharacterized protein YdhG (YjbR/CyaY superfamily)
MAHLRAGPTEVVSADSRTMARSDYKSVDDYIAAQPQPERAVLEQVRATIRKALPGATEGISYQIPVYKLDGIMVLYFAGFRYHYSIYPATPTLVNALRKELAGYLHSKATLRFPFADVVPTRLIARIAKVRAVEAARLGEERAAKPASKKTKSRQNRKVTRRRARKR